MQFLLPRLGMVSKYSGIWPGWCEFLVWVFLWEDHSLGLQAVVVAVQTVRRLRNNFLVPKDGLALRLSWPSFNTTAGLLFGSHPRWSDQD